MGAEKGKLGLGTVVFLSLVALGIYLGFKIAPPYWEYYSLKEAARQGLVSASAPPYRDADAKEFVLEKAKRVGLPLKEGDLILLRDGKAVRIEFSWEREVVLPYYTRHFAFTVKDSEPIH